MGMRQAAVRWSRWSALLAAAWLALPQAAFAHERFIKHYLKKPLHNEFFRQQPGVPFGMDPSYLRIGAIGFLLLAILLIIWFLRHELDMFIEMRVLEMLRGKPQQWLRYLADFLTDRPVKLRWFHALGEWAVVFFLRSPALVLMYSATDNSMVMPSYPLEPTSAIYYQYIQVILACFILTQALYPLTGALVLGTWIYLFRWGWYVAADAMPVLSAAVLYVSSPWQSHKLAITDVNVKQMRWVRLTLGFGFMVLGWLKILNHDLTAGVADNYPSVMNDPMIQLFEIGAKVHAYPRECWVVAFAMAEIFSGFMLMTGIFNRVWASIMVFMFTKLMFVDFGWAEIPHLYPIAALLVIVFSNKLTDEFAMVRNLVLKAGKEERTVAQIFIVVVASLAISFLAVFPLLYLCTFVDRVKWFG